MIALVNKDETEFIELVTKQTKESASKRLKESKKEIETSKARIDKLDSIIQHLYEDNLEGKISDDRFQKLSTTYETEQKELSIRVTELQKYINSESQKLINIDAFISHVKKYTNIQELNCEVIRELVNKVLVHKVEKENGKRAQRIDVIFNGLENIEINH